MFRLCILLFGLLSAPLSAQVHETASQGVVSLAMRQPWPRLPTSREIAQAEQDYSSQLTKGLRIATGATQMFVPWETDPLLSNKVVLTVTGGMGPDSVMVLGYDFMKSRFQFKGVWLSGVKRYRDDKSTGSYLEPQDLVHLRAGWRMVAMDGIPEPVPQVANGTPKIVQKPLLDAVADQIAGYLMRANGSCFSRVIHLGDPQRFRDAIRTNLDIWPNSALFWVNTGAEASHQTTTGHNGIMHLRFDPTVGERTRPELRRMTHEMIHHMELQHDLKRPRGAPGVERNTDWLDQVSMYLDNWALAERQVMTGNQKPEKAWATFMQLEDNLREAQAQFGPELANLQNWAGIRVDVDQLRQLYLGPECGNDAFRRMVQLSDYMRAHPELDGHLPVALGGEPADQPDSLSVDSSSARHIVYASVLDKATGKPLAGVRFYVLQSGTTVGTWAANRYGSQYVISQGKSDGTGMVVLDQSLPKGKTYSFVVAKEGYKTISYDALSIGPNSPEPLKITVKMMR